MRSLSGPPGPSIWRSTIFATLGGGAIRAMRASYCRRASATGSVCVAGTPVPRAKAGSADQRALRSSPVADIVAAPVPTLPCTVAAKAAFALWRRRAGIGQRGRRLSSEATPQTNKTCRTSPTLIRRRPERSKDLTERSDTGRVAGVRSFAEVCRLLRAAQDDRKRGSRLVKFSTREVDTFGCSSTT